MDFDLEVLHELENDLEVNEKISLIFLLYDDVLVAQEKLYLMNKAYILNGPTHRTNLLSNWACHEKTQWKEKIVEGLLIIKAYSNVIKLSLDPDRWSKHFLPDQMHISFFINTIKKKLFNLCESLHSKDVVTIISHIRNDYKQKNINVTELYEDKYYIQNFELYLLDLLVSKYILDKDVQNEKDDHVKQLIDIFNKIAKRDNLIHVKKEFHNNSIKKSEQNNSTHIASMSSDHDSEDSNMTIKGVYNTKSEISTELVYTICNYQNVGKMYIINVEEFENKKNPELAKKYTKRLGSRKDVDNLCKTWKYFGFEPFVEHNLKAEDIIEKLGYVLKYMVHEEHSAFIVCILSHGEKDVLIGSDCKPVSIERIESLFNASNAPKLAGKPKILLIQSCQGNEKLGTVDPSSILQRTRREYIAHDGPRINNTIPEKLDTLKFQSTIPYFQSFRDIENGSWFIQTLCENMNQIEINSSKCFTKLCTEVIRDVSSERIEGYSQTPIYQSTFTKEFYLKKIQS